MKKYNKFYRNRVSDFHIRSDKTTTFVRHMIDETAPWGGYWENEYTATPSSLARVCRLLQGQPAFGKGLSIEVTYKGKAKPLIYLDDEPEQVCEWKCHEDVDSIIYYETTCHDAFWFTDGDVETNLFKFCPYCKGKIKVIE